MEFWYFRKSQIGYEPQVRNQAKPLNDGALQDRPRGPQCIRSDDHFLGIYKPWELQRIRATG